MLTAPGEGPRPGSPGRSKPTEPRTLDTAELFGSDSEIVLLHRGASYRLRITRQDKLILTK